LEPKRKKATLKRKHPIKCNELETDEIRNFLFLKNKETKVQEAGIALLENSTVSERYLSYSPKL
jgi:hypothetical protein